MYPTSFYKCQCRLRLRLRLFCTVGSIEDFSTLLQCLTWNGPAHLQTKVWPCLGVLHVSYCEWLVDFRWGLGIGGYLMEKSCDGDPESRRRFDFVDMVYVENWDEFMERSVQLFRSDPEATRYQTKYRHCDGKLVVKVTDNKECLKYKTDQAQDLKKLEKLNNIFFTLMARGPEADLSEVSGTQQAESQPAKRGRGRKQ